ncbi:hypothetical protein H310_05247 [Aphanomyces invadans]|uniref:Serine/threonine-protein phosphatase n=1 Tax=Aphanomyces invadans TaxID=157072 RepID=A0A024UAT8_9STRA|nr:hypothetical protein H310_05247 [Aphanomyces invadans]ETW02748.1 hypothetical protein H310_05247 [Aphanomyces invadans]|eukprot:XP_008868132.1 hypothetical protein H310_05247 [Aphanomyces invadans]
MGNSPSRAVKEKSFHGDCAEVPTPPPSSPGCGGSEPASPASTSTGSTDDRFSLTQWKLFNDLETREESDLLELTSFLHALHEYMPSRDDNSLSSNQLSMAMSRAQIDISDMYKGIRLDNPLTPQNAIDLVDGFKRHQPLHRDYAMQILFSTLAMLQDKPNVTYLDIAPHPHITVVGDIHGQLDDLLLIFDANGLPSPTNPYVFNGDLVDRGPRGVECALLVFAFMLVYPEAVHVNRGNHEDKFINASMGFMKECMAKYDADVFDTFGYVFSWLPLAVVLNKRILIVHGGVPRHHTFRLDEMNAIPRADYDVCRFKTRPKSTSPPLEKAQFKQNQIVQDILWSDPMTTGADWVENRRGAGIYYGAHHVHKFMAHNNLDWIIRSHECVPQGFAWPFGDKGMLVTLFSASNYCGVANNLGCFMRIPSSRDAKPSFYQYMATTSESDLVATNLDGLFDIIVTHREDLLRQFQAVDSSSTQCVSTAQWDAVMQQTLQMHLNWASIRPLLTSTEANQTIDYVEFLNRYQARGTCGADDAAATPEGPADRRDVFNNMYRYRKRLQALFQVLDQDGNGTITLNELTAGIDILNKHLPPGMKPFTHPEELMNALDLTHDNAININEFMECFRIHANLTSQAKWRRARSKLKIMSALGMLKVVSAAPIVTASDVSFDNPAAADSPLVSPP